MAAVLGASVTRDFAGDCGGAGCAWQLEGKVSMPGEADKPRRTGWMNRFLDRVTNGTVYPSVADAHGHRGHGFVNGGKIGPHVEQVTSCLKSVIPLDANLVILDFSLSGGNRNVEEILRLLDTYPKKPAVMFVVLQTWALDEDGVADLHELQVTIGEDNVTEAKRRFALSVSNATAIRERNTKATRERDAHDCVDVARVYNATVVSLPAILIPELIADDTDAAMKAWEAGRKPREAREFVASVDEDEPEDGEEEEREGVGAKEGVKNESKRRRHHYWPIRGWCDDGIHPRAEYAYPYNHYENWMAQALAYAVKRADDEAVALETETNDGIGGIEKIEDTLPPLPDPLDESLRVVSGAAHCYSWECPELSCPNFHAQEKAPFLAPRVVYNSTPADIVPGGPDGGIWGWHHTQHPIHGDVSKFKPGLVTTAAGAVIGLAIDTAYGKDDGDIVGGGEGGEGEGYHGNRAGDALVKIFYLTSYERMGMARVSCEGGCECRPRTLDGHTVRRESVVHVARMGVSQSENCTLRVEIAAETRDPKGGHKFKIFQINVTPPSSARTHNTLTKDRMMETEIMEKYNQENVFPEV